MARKRQGDEEEVPELNLAPIMNMVVILIPLLLLSVVFMEVGVFNITAPKLSIGPPSDAPPPEEEPLNLTVAVGAKGFNVAASGGSLPPLAGCETPGPTICLDEKGVDTSAEFTAARAALVGGDLAKGEAALKKGNDAYSWHQLYNQLVKIKKQYKDETVIKISADPDIPYSTIARVIDVARMRFEKDSYSNATEFWTAAAKSGGESEAVLFPDPVLTIAQ